MIEPPQTWLGNIRAAVIVALATSDARVKGEPDRCGNTWRALTQPSASTEQEGYTMVANHTPPTPRNGVKRGQG